jgi:hypothetical protein
MIDEGFIEDQAVLGLSLTGVPVPAARLEAQNLTWEPDPVPKLADQR